MRKIPFVALLLWVIGAALPAYAQVDTGTLVGTVRDTSDAVLAAATVTATNTDTGVVTSATTNANGEYVLTPLHIGTWSVAVEAKGFQKEIRNGIVLNVQQNIRLDFTLKVGSVSQTTIVTGAAPLVETENASLGDVITSTQVEELPLNGRRYTDLAVSPALIPSDGQSIRTRFTTPPPLAPSTASQHH